MADALSSQAIPQGSYERDAITQQPIRRIVENGSPEFLPANGSYRAEDGPPQGITPPVQFAPPPGPGNFQAPVQQQVDPRQEAGYWRSYGEDFRRKATELEPDARAWRDLAGTLSQPGVMDRFKRAWEAANNPNAPPPAAQEVAGTPPPAASPNTPPPSQTPNQPQVVATVPPEMVQYLQSIKQGQEQILQFQNQQQVRDLTGQVHRKLQEMHQKYGQFDEQAVINIGMDKKIDSVEGLEAAYQWYRTYRGDAGDNRYVGQPGAGNQVSAPQQAYYPQQQAYQMPQQAPPNFYGPNPQAYAQPQVPLGYQQQYVNAMRPPQAQTPPPGPAIPPPTRASAPSVAPVASMEQRKYNGAADRRQAAVDYARRLPSMLGMN